MPTRIISDTFEALEQLGSQMKQQTKQAAKTIVQEGKKSLGLAAGEKAGQVVEGGGKQQTQQTQAQQIQKMEQIAKQKAAQRYKQIQQEILVISRKKQQELPEQVTGKPGFSEEKVIKQLEEEKKPEAEKKKTEEPLPIKKERRKAEMYRGVSG